MASRKRVTVYDWTVSTSKGTVAEGTSKDEPNARRCAREAMQRRGLKRATVDVHSRRVRMAGEAA